VSSPASSPALRLFVALELPDEVRFELVRWRAAVFADEPGLRPVLPEGLHVTLCFLGAVVASAVPSVLEACAVLATRRAIDVRVGEPLWLPRRRPRVLAVRLDDDAGHLGSMQAALASALAAAGVYEPEPRPYLAHVTVARVPRGARVRARGLSTPARIAFRGHRVTLFRSRLGRGGARYEPLGSVELAASS